MLMGLEQRRVIGLLLVRSATSFAQWLRLHPGVEMITRDRCGLYAEGAREGAPSSAQVNGRDHLISNLSEAVERTLQQLQIEAPAELAPETSDRDRFLRYCPTAYQVRKLALQFRAMLRWRRSIRLSKWIEAAVGSRFPLIAQFARTLRRDLRAVELAMSAPWSKGPPEEHINRFRVLKRQMYGRAGFELLKARVLPLLA